MSTLRVTKEQARLLFGQKPQGARPARRSLTKQERASLPENVVERQIRDFLEHRGWQAIRQQVGTYVAYRQFAELKETGHNKGPVIPIRIGEKSACDWRFVRPVPPTGLISALVPLAGMQGFVQSFELETKAPESKPNPDQIKYIEKRNILGFLATWVDSLDSFIEFYKLHFGDR